MVDIMSFDYRGQDSIMYSAVILDVVDTETDDCCIVTHIASSVTLNE